MNFESLHPSYAIFLIFGILLILVPLLTGLYVSVKENRARRLGDYPSKANRRSDDIVNPKPKEP